ncbi:MAG: radical SAM protein [Pseudomonadales bacterium]
MSDLILRQPAGKFANPVTTRDGEPRAWVDLRQLRTLWFNTGTLCNLTCRTCYIESSPSNDRLGWISAAEVTTFLDEALGLHAPPPTIAFTGGEPFMNPGILAMLEAALERDYPVLVLTNAMRPMMKCAPGLAALHTRYPDRITVRVSIDHYTAARHEQERGRRSFEPMLKGLRWLIETGLIVHVAGRTCWDESEHELRAGYASLFASLGLTIDANDPETLVLFPDMDASADVPEITTACWGILDVHPDNMMCASSRMVVKRRGAQHPVVLACTLVTEDPGFELGSTLKTAAQSVALNHPHCARFCVLGGGSCSA